MKNNVFSRFSLILWLVILLSPFVGLHAADVFDEELDNLLARPTITKKSLPDGTVISTVSVPWGSSDSVAGFITLPDGVKVQFTKSASLGTTTFVNLSNGSTSTCSGSSCSGNINVSPALQSSFSSVSKSVASSSDLTGNSSAGSVTVYVSEKVPGATCTCATKWYEWQEDCPSTLAVSDRLYQCSIDKWMWAFQSMIGAITKWFIYLTMLFWVLALVWAWILWAWGSESEEYTKKAKGWAVNIIIGLGLLFTFRYILWFLAPWIFM